jgi:hypothetical protein
MDKPDPRTLVDRDLYWRTAQTLQLEHNKNTALVNMLDKEMQTLARIKGTNNTLRKRLAECMHRLRSSADTAEQQ